MPPNPNLTHSLPPASWTPGSPCGGGAPSILSSFGAALPSPSSRRRPRAPSPRAALRASALPAFGAALAYRPLGPRRRLLSPCSRRASGSLLPCSLLPARAVAGTAMLDMHVSAPAGEEQGLMTCMPVN
ncbi:uncharacterized protein [Zea mays]|uniref:uncharacterized protein n=1 Tax=Zea mays TaxID=4577 RepID=UPI0004DEAEE1|nr:uncharacterized protein LOC103630258 [Zea mays]|eukprot:XP_008649549.1 uncharacterized protein LOC103630258 [Zea mays]